MSLKFVHQIIIFAGITISLVFAGFCFFDSTTEGSVLFKIAGAGGIVAAIGLVAYEIHFLKKTRKLIL